MARIKDKQKAIKLRLKGKSYSEIRKELVVSKSSLSEWLRNFPLSKNRFLELSREERRVESYRATMHRKRKIKLENAYSKAKDIIGNLNNREVFISGIFLYWGEGDKNDSTVSVSNTDPNIMKFFVKWLENLGVKKEDMKIVLHLYSDMNENKEKEFWSKTLKIGVENFRKTYTKETKLSNITYKNGFGHGTCMIRVYDKELKSLILMCLKYIGANL
ncbi:MAG: helix-turn-helix domain-containing protein [bacterium]